MKNHYDTRVLRPSLPNEPTKFLVLRPLYKLYYKNFYFPPSLRNIYPNYRELF